MKAVVDSRVRATDAGSSSVSEFERKRKRCEEEDEKRLLREEQDRKYRQTLLADQMKDVGRAEAKERERRNETEKREMKPIETAMEASVLEDARARMERAGSEPPITGGVEGASVVQLRFALPSGRKIDRRFYDTGRSWSCASTSWASQA